jgi:hypothetical protein
MEGGKMNASHHSRNNAIVIVMTALVRHTVRSSGTPSVSRCVRMSRPLTPFGEDDNVFRIVSMRTIRFLLPPHLSRASAFVALFVVALAGAASAQQQTLPPQPPAADAEVGFERRPQLSLQEELVQGDAVIARIDAAAMSVRKQLEVARAVEHDSVKTLCLNDKLSQLDVALRSARDRRTDLIAAVQRTDVELSNHEFTILTVLRQRSEQLGAEAQQCIGAEVAFVGQTTVVPYVNPSLPAEEGAQFPPADPSVVTASPQCASCTGTGQ